MRFTEEDGIIYVGDIKIDFPFSLWTKLHHEVAYSLIFEKVDKYPIMLLDFSAGTYDIMAKNEEAQDTDTFIVKGEEHVGRYFDNYKGTEVITADDLLYHFLAGIPVNRENATLRKVIKSAVTLFESEMRVNVTQKIVKTMPESNEKKGVNFDVEDDPYPLVRTQMSLSIMRIRYVPIISVERIRLFAITGRIIRDVTQWTRLDKHKGQIRLFPSLGKAGQISTSSSFGVVEQLLLQGYQWDYQDALWADYTCGMDVNLLPDIYYQIIGMIASILLLIPVSEEIRVGWQSVSFSIDGISQSVSAPAGLQYGERIKEYKEFVSEYFKRNKYQRGYTIAHV